MLTRVPHFLFCMLNDCLYVIMIEPVTIFLGCTTMWICRYICSIFSMGTHMELPVVTFTVE